MCRRLYLGLKLTETDGAGLASAEPRYSLKMNIGFNSLIIRLIYASNCDKQR